MDDSDRRVLTSAEYSQRSERADNNPKEVCQVHLIDGVLYKKSFTAPLLRCLEPAEAEYVLKEIHEGVCGNHMGGRSLALKALKQGFYWPTMRKDAIEMVKKCYKCQEFAKVPRLPAEELRAITSPWPFSLWGLDLIGPLPEASGRRKFIIVACDYFTKWVEAEPLASITQHAVEKFIWQNIICRFGIPHAIISDNGLQIQAKYVKEFCERFKIKMIASSVDYPQTNGQVEAMNQKVLSALKKKMADAKGSWIDVLHDVLWAIRTTSHTGTGETPFSLTYGTEAVIPAEMGISSLRTASHEPNSNETNRRADLDLIEEHRSISQERLFLRAQQVGRYFNRKVRNRQFQIGDLVLRSCEASRPASERKKLSPNWEGPYQISEVLAKGAYKLKHLDGKDVPRTWNVIHLKKFFQ